MSATPPPRSPVMNPPPAPRFGAFEDKWEPFVPRLTRASAKRQRARTPTQDDIFGSSSAHPSSPPPSTRKTNGRFEADRTMTGMRNAGLAAPVLVNGMLPTPTKTPKKRRNIDAPASRMLFSSPTPAEATPSRKRRGFKFGELDGATTEQEQGFDIFTDSRDRMPEVDVTPENPFFGPGARDPDSPEALKALEKPRSEERDGIYVTFRGKKVFRPFEHRETSPTPGAAEAAGESTMGAEPVASFTPRVLFPTRKQEATIEQRESSQNVDYVGEEDLTDIDESNLGEVASEGDHDVFSPEDTTAISSIQAPATPPSDLSEPATQPKTPEPTLSLDGKSTAHARKPHSAFNDWKVTKPGSGVPAKRKQEPASSGSNTERTLKRVRSSIH